MIQVIGGGSAAFPASVAALQVGSNNFPGLTFGGNGTVGAHAFADGIDSGDWSVATAGKGLRVKEGTNAKQGIATLVAGTVVVANTSVTASSRIFLTCNNSAGTPGFVRVSARTAGTSFTILSSSGTDTSDIAWQIFEPA